MVLLPQPDGPTIRPTFHGRSFSGSSTSQDSSEVFDAGRSNKPRTCATRGDSTTGDETMMCMMFSYPSGTYGTYGTYESHTSHTSHIPSRRRLNSAAPGSAVFR